MYQNYPLALKSEASGHHNIHVPHLHGNLVSVELSCLYVRAVQYWWTFVDFFGGI